MARKTAPIMQGLVIPDDRLTWANRDTTIISASESGPQPGSPLGADAKSEMLPAISGTQTSGVDVRAARAGFGAVDPTRSAGVMYRLDGEALTEWRGWVKPWWLSVYESLKWSTSLNYLQMDMVTIPGSQKVLAAYTRDSTSEQLSVRVLDPTTWVWGSEVAAAPSRAYEDVAMAMASDTRILLIRLQRISGAPQWTVLYSDDEGATWADYSVDPFGPGVPDPLLTVSLTKQQSRMVVGADGDTLFVRTVTDVGVRKLTQWASSDFGGSFQKVDDWTSSAPDTEVSLVQLTSGAIGVIYARSGAVYWREIGSPWDAIEDATEVTIASTFGTAPTGVAAWADADGALWAVCDDSQALEVYVSYDQGATWNPAGASNVAILATGDASTTIVPKRGVSAMGRAIVIGNSTSGAGTSPDGAVHSLICGGWSNLEESASGTAASLTAGATGRTWVPVELPDTVAAWTASGTGTAALTSPGHLAISTSGTFKSYLSASFGSINDIDVTVDLEVTSGGSTTTNRVGVDIDWTDGTNQRSWLLNFTTTQWAFFDGAGAGIIGGAVTHGVTGRLQVRVYIDYNAGAPLLSTWYKAAKAENWTLHNDRVSLPVTAGAGTSRVTWGHQSTASAATSEWYQVTYRYTTAGDGELRPKANIGLDSYEGKALTALPYPVPGVGSAGSAGFLSVVDGPAILGETWDIDASSPYALSQAYPDVAPSPEDEWRSTDTTEQIVSGWVPASAGVDSALGSDSACLVVRNTNAPLVSLAGYNGSVWATIAEFDPSFPAVSYTRDGDSITANTAGSGDAGRYLWEGELVGGWVDLGSGKRRNIIRQSAGYFNADAASPVKQARIWLAGVDGTEGATGTCTIYHHSGIAIAHDAPTYEAYRVRIPASSNADGYFRLGAHLVGSFVAHGRRVSRGWQWQKSLNARTQTDSRRTTRTTETGPAPLQLSMSWPDQVDLTGIRGGAADYIAGDFGDPLAAVDDVPWLLMGHVDSLKSGEVPCAALQLAPLTARASLGGETVTDPTLWLYGRVVSSVSASHVVGDEASDELYRVASLTVEEIV